jgi:O-antigen ligase
MSRSSRLTGTRSGPLTTFSGSPRFLAVAGIVLWLLALVGASTGYYVGQAVYDRGTVYGRALPVLQDLDSPRRAVNTQLEIEADADAVHRSLRLIKAAGFGMIRQQFSWAAVEGGAKGQSMDTNLGRSTWERFDEIIRLAGEEGIEVLARIDLPPEWSRPPGSYKTHPPRDVRDYGDFVERFAERYAGQVRYIQLWNEPNLNEEWGRQPVDPAGYVELLRAGHQGAKRGNPHVRVISAALAQTLEPDSPSAAGLDDLLFLDRMYAHGAKPYFDVLAVNAYGLWHGPEDRRVGAQYTNFPRVLLSRDVMLRHGDGGKAVWVAEFGWNALPPDWGGQPSPWGFVSPEMKSQHILGAYRRALVEWPWMGSMALWLFRKPGADMRDPTPFFGLVDDDWTPRPAFDALEASADRQALGTGVHQESSSGLNFGGTWQWTPDNSASLGAFRESPVSGATLTWRFRGTNVDLLAPVGPSRGMAHVKINGAYTLANHLPLNQNGQATVDFFAPQAQAQRRIPLASGLPDAIHTVELTVTGEHAAASTGAGVGIDAVMVWRARPLLPLLALSGGWVLTGLAGLWYLRSRLLFADYAQLLPSVWGGWRQDYGFPGGRSPIEGLRLFWQLPWTKVAVLVVVASLPFASFVIRTPAGSFSPVELAVLAAIAIYCVRLYLGTERLSSRGALLGPAVLLVIAGLASLLVADYPRLALRELRTLVIEPALFYVVARNVLRGPRDAYWIVTVLVTGAAAAGVVALAQTSLGVGLVAAEGVARATAFYPSPNHLGLFLGRAVPLATAGALYLRGNRQWYFAAATGLCLVALFLTFSRGAWLATAIALLVVAMPRAFSLAPRHQRRMIVASALIVPPLILVAGLLAQQVERFQSLLSTAGTGFLRLHLWTSALQMAMDHPLFGVGLDQFLYHYPMYLHPDAWREPNLSHPHNLVLDFWLRLGVLGLGALAWASIVFVRSLIRGRAIAREISSSDPTRIDRVWITYGIAGSAIAFALHGLVDNSYFLIDLAYIAWLMLLVAEMIGERPD